MQTGISYSDVATDVINDGRQAGICRNRVSSLTLEEKTASCHLSNGTSFQVPRFLATFLQIGDEVEIPTVQRPEQPELRICRNRQPRELYHAKVGYVTQAKQDKRGEWFLRAEVANSGLGVKALVLPARTARDYFYAPDRKTLDRTTNLYTVLKTPPSSSPAEIRLGYKLRRLELESRGASRFERHLVERAFNILAQPDFRACHDALLAPEQDENRPASFPYGGFGLMLAGGELAADRETFFVHRIISFLADHHRRQFRAPLRRFEFFNGYALYRDSRRKVQVIVDPVVLPLTWDCTWNAWKHLIGTNIGIEATFVSSGKYRLRSGDWHLVSWETALPSRLEVTVPPDAHRAIESARSTYRRLGQFIDVIEDIRGRIEQEPLEHDEVVRLCDQARIPPDFDIALISWKPDYDPFYYNQLRRCSRKMFLFRDEYIFDCEHSIAVEVPKAGHATYVFARPNDVVTWVREYARTSKDEIRKNRGGIGERLGFIGRVTHGARHKTWLKELLTKMGE